jgi:hypothetical protein
LAHFGTLCALCALDEAVVQKRFEAIVDGNAYAYAYAYERPWHKDRKK